MPRTLLRRLITSAALAWLSVRTALAVLGVVTVPSLGVIALAAVILFITWLDLRRSTELAILANLAVSPFRASAIVVATALLLEVLVGGPLAATLLTHAAGS